MDKIVEAFGIEMLVMMGVSLTAFLFVSTVPIWWPALRARRRSAPLPRPWLFVAVVSTNAYGAANIVLIVLGMPVGAYMTFLAPQLEEGGLAQWP